MRNLKAILLSFFVLFMFGCETGQTVEDEIPDIPSRAGGLGINGHFGVQIIEITVWYAPTHNRSQIRTVYGGGLGLINYVPCTGDPGKEIWRIPYISQTEFYDTIDSITLSSPLYTIPPPTASDGNGGDDDMAGQIDEIGSVATVNTRFLHSNECQ
jgi:hypothetical protein